MPKNHFMFKLYTMIKEIQNCSGKNLKDLSWKPTVYNPNYINDDDGNSITEPKQTAETVNDFFTNIFGSASSKNSTLSEENKSVLIDYINSKINSEHEFKIPPISEKNWT